MIFSRHVRERLAAYAEDQLDPRAHAAVRAHLDSCSRCRSALQDVQRGIAFASELGAEPMPAAAAARVEERLAALRADCSGGERRRTWRLWSGPAAAAALLAAVLSWHLNRPWTDVSAGDAASIAFERAAREVHARLREDGRLQLATADEGRIRRWMAEQHAPIASIAADRPGAERGRFVPRGVSVERVAGVRSSVLEYSIDGRAVTLVVATQSDVAGAPPSGWLSKRIVHRRSSEGLNTLTWSTGGQSYVLVSELDGLGQGACFVCHTDTRFRDAIAALSLR